MTPALTKTEMQTTAVQQEQTLRLPAMCTNYVSFTLFLNAIQKSLKPETLFKEILAQTVSFAIC